MASGEQRHDEGDFHSWHTVHREIIIKDDFKHVEIQRCRLPNGEEFPKYYIDRYQDWVNVVALTPENDFIFVKQYRHAFGQVTLETPAGTLDPGENDPFTGAQRELVEETGYVPGTMIKLGSLAPNPAIQDNLVHIFLATNCIKKGRQQLDLHESIEVILIKQQDIYREIARGTFVHALALVAILMALPKLVKNQDSDLRVDGISS